MTTFFKNNRGTCFLMFLHVFTLCLIWPTFSKTTVFDPHFDEFILYVYLIKSVLFLITMSVYGTCRQWGTQLLRDSSHLDKFISRLDNSSTTTAAFLSVSGALLLVVAACSSMNSSMNGFGYAAGVVWFIVSVMVILKLFTELLMMPKLSSD